MKVGTCLLLGLLSMAVAAAEEPSELHLPFNVGGLGLDTGIAVTNRSGQSGTFSFELFRTASDGSVESHVIESTDLAVGGIGVGLEPAGTLAPGATYRVLATQLAAQAGVTSFVGQVRITAAFPRASGVNFIFDSSFETTHGYPAQDDLAGIHLLPPDGLPPLIWPAKFACGYIPDLLFGIWMTDIEVLNPGSETVLFRWKAVTEDGLISSGSFDLGPNGVLDIPCDDEPFLLSGKGFLEVTAEEDGEQRLLQVVSIVKNFEFSEVNVEKGYGVPPIPVDGRWVYASEFLCGNARPQRPNSFDDLLQRIEPADLPRVWRPGYVSSTALAYNAGTQPFLYTFRVLDSVGEVLVSSERELMLAPGGVRKFDCALLPAVVLAGPLVEGFLVVEGNSDLLKMTWDKTDYNVVLTNSQDVEYIEPLRGRLEVPD